MMNRFIFILLESIIAAVMAVLIVEQLGISSPVYIAVLVVVIERMVMFIIPGGSS